MKQKATKSMVQMEGTREEQEQTKCVPNQKASGLGLRLEVLEARVAPGIRTFWTL